MTAEHPVAAVPRPPRSTDLPDGFTVQLAADVHRSRNGRLLYGGSPPRLLRLNERTARLLDAGQFTASDPATRAVARKLLDAGVVHPRPPAVRAHQTSIVIPVRDRADMLERLLTALRSDADTADLPVLVVDDGSRDPTRIAAAARRHGARVLRHEHNLGPAVARNTGLRHSCTRFVAFIDSDVVPCPGWLPTLLGNFLDPAVGLAAPRVVPLHRENRNWLDAFEETRSPLDMGPREGPVAPLTQLSYVPSTTIVVRREAVPWFAVDMRVGEDVDLCMRMHRAGWRLRYVPTARVAHEHRTDLLSWVGQRAFYGTSAAPLSLRHPGQVPPLHTAWWSSAATILLLNRRTAPLAVALTASAAVRLAKRMPDADTPARAGALLALGSLHATAQQLARAATRHYWPLSAAAALTSRRARRLLAAAALVEGLLDHRNSSSPLPPLAHVLVRRLDDLAYGAGLWWGAIRNRTLAPLLPRIERVFRSRNHRRPPMEEPKCRNGSRQSPKPTGAPRNACPKPSTKHSSRAANEA
ncbi:mycofactocin biosynthesis glycosyltransferase MftF [Saccharopolyspora rectivirgula]|uniref:mycofactocin biosynthesis glycosyltransferase MftF n=1 Tax=Saccharopolyspora rectivirgula TaxID=28042 RepID=UPI000427D914|nr:mycofactocin biosynthesis glycosyltransferase MftF [Saccharopolyspora rectivirgula]